MLLFTIHQSKADKRCITFSEYKVHDDDDMADAPPANVCVCEYLILLVSVVVAESNPASIQLTLYIVPPLDWSMKMIVPDKSWTLSFSLDYLYKFSEPLTLCTLIHWSGFYRGNSLLVAVGFPHFAIHNLSSTPIFFPTL